MLIELYLLRTDGIVEGYIGGVTDISKASYVWRPEKLQHNGGLDTTEQSPGPGEYRVLLLIRNKTPSNGIEDPVDILTDEFDTFDGENILIPDGSKGQPDYAHPFILPLLASDVSDAAFVLQ
ncbi:MAG: hypothetical protein JWM56_261 [Candidatus Peribacteria bacterium]|nr:hypothetical protein [Candidatus Peribacteria bacterium]